MFQELDGLFGRLSESKMKSECVGSAWAKKRKDAATKLVTKRVPGWINFQDGKLVLNEVKAATVRRTFKLSVAGHGVQAIAKQLNKERVPVMGRKALRGRIMVWNDTVVYHVLKSRATHATKSEELITANQPTGTRSCGRSRFACRK